MKKTKLLTGGLVVLGGAWLGLTWYSGKLAENYYQTNIDIIKANIYKSVLVDSSNTVKIKDESYTRHFFYSDLSFTVEMATGYDNSSIEIPIKSKIYHGPFPANELKSFNLMPKMFSAITQVDKTEHTNPLFDIIPSEVPISATNSASYFGEISGSLLINKGQYTLDEYNLIKWKTLQTNFSYSSFDKNKIDGKMNIPLIDVELNYDKNKTNILLEDLTYKLDLKQSELENIWIGEGGISTKQVSYSYSPTDENDSDDFFNLNLKKTDATATVKNSNQHNFVDIDLTFDIDNILANNSKKSDAQNFGSLKFNTSLNHLYAQAMNNILERLIIKKNASFNNIDLFKPIKEILQNQPNFSINPFILSNKEGKAKIENQLTLKKLNNQIMKNEEFIYNLTLTDLLEKLNLSTNVSRSWLLSSANKVFTLLDKNTTKKEIEIKANSFVDELWDRLKEYEHFIEINKEKLEFKLFIKDNKLYLNKKEITKEEQNNYKSFVLMFLPILLR